jgi:hypothetical protein
MIRSFSVPESQNANLVSNYKATRHVDIAVKHESACRVRDQMTLITAAEATSDLLVVFLRWHNVCSPRNIRVMTLLDCGCG